MKRILKTLCIALLAVIALGRGNELSAQTDCNNVKSPYFEGFETTTPGKLPDCWTEELIGDTITWKVYNNDLSDDYFYPQPRTGHTGKARIYFYRNQYDVETPAISKLTGPAIKVEQEADYFDFSFIHTQNMRMNGKQDQLKIYYKTSEAGDWEVLKHFTNNIQDFSKYQHFFEDLDYFRFAIEGTSNDGTGIIVDDIGLTPCNNIETFPFEEGFTGLPDCWMNTTESNSPWIYLTRGYSPNVTPHSGEGMLQFNNYNFYPGTTGLLITPPLLPDGNLLEVTFWMYRDNGMSDCDDRVNIYVSDERSIAGKTPSFTVHRHSAKAPAETEGNGWYQYTATLNTLGMEKAFVIFEGVAEEGNNTYIDDISINLFDGSAIPLNISEGFNKEIFPPAGWLHQGDESITWKRLAEGTQPTVAPVEGAGMIYFNSASEAFDGKKALLSSPNFITNEENQSFSFWMYRDNMAPEQADKVNIYLSSTTDITGLAPVFTVHRPRKMSPVEPAAGWYQYVVPLATASMETAYVLLEAVGAGGANIYVDLAEIGAFCYPPQNVSASLVVGDYGMYRGLVEWEAPKPKTDALAGYKVYRGSMLLDEIDDPDVLSYEDMMLFQATNYSVVAIYDNSCGVSERVASNTLTPASYCGELSPTEISFQTHAGDWYDILLTWPKPDDPDFQEFEIVYNVYMNGQLVNAKDFVRGESYVVTVPQGGTYDFSVDAVILDFNCRFDMATGTVSIGPSPCEALMEMPVKEGFEMERFPSMCWDAASLERADWRRVEMGSSPAVAPYKGTAMLEFGSAGYPEGNAGMLISPKFSTDTDNALSFWIYRDADAATTAAADRVNIYLSPTPGIEGLAPIMTIHRAVALAPVVEKAGWYECRTALNTAAMTGAYLIFEGISGEGGNIYIDDIVIFNPNDCDPVEEIVVKQMSEAKIVISWKAPMNEHVAGYRVVRDGAVIHSRLQENGFTDYVYVGRHDYTITALFDQPGCEESTPVEFTVDVLPLCDAPVEVIATKISQADVRVEWAAEAIDIESYSVYRNGAFVTTTPKVSYVDRNLEAGEYRYTVVVNYIDKPCAVSEGTISNAVKVDCCVPATGLSAKAEGEAVVVQWSYAGNPTGFNEENFTETMNNAIPSTWRNIANGNHKEYAWSHRPDGGIDNGGFVASLSYTESDGFLDPDNWLISPPIELDGKGRISYQIKTLNQARPNEYYGVYLSTTGNNPADFKLLFQEGLRAANAEWQQKTVELGNHTGTVYVAFRHYDTSPQAGIGLDEVAVYNVWGYPRFAIVRDGLQIATTETTAYTDTEVARGKSYEYCVRALFNTCTMEAACTQVTLPECATEPISKLTLDGDKESGKVSISWEYPTAGATFNVFRNNVLIGVADSKSFEDHIAHDITYRYCIQPVHADCAPAATVCDTISVRTDPPEEPQVGVEANGSAGIAVYPNPASTHVTIEAAAMAEITLYNLFGQPVERRTVAGANLFAFDLSRFEPGIYILKIKNTDGKMFSKPLVLTR